jgi:hypothetical protein
MRKAEITAIALAAGLSGWAAPAAADTIVLKNGNVLEGKVVERTNETVTLQVGDAGTMTLRTANIASEQANDRDGSRIVKYALRAGVPVAPETRAPAAGTEPREAEAQPAGLPRGTSPELGLPVEGTVAISPGELDAVIRLNISQMGEPRHKGPRAIRRDEAMLTLVRVGAQALPALTDALTSEANWFTRSNAARTIEMIASRPRDLTTDLLLWRAVPVLIRQIDDNERWPRVNANAALTAITGETIVRPIDISATPSPAHPVIPDVPPDAGMIWQMWWVRVGSNILAQLELRNQGWFYGTVNPQPYPYYQVPAGMPTPPLGRVEGTIDQPFEAGGWGAQ